MASLIQAVKIVSILAGAILLGQWFLTEVKRARRMNRPWYSAYLTPPGILVLIALLFLPLLHFFARG